MVYWSRYFNNAERAYYTTHKEILAVVWTVLLLRPYMVGAWFKIQPDHDALGWILNLADAPEQLG